MDILNNRFTLINDKWEFTLLPDEAEITDISTCEWKEVSLPHDWLIYDTHNLYASGVGFYKRTITISDLSKLAYALEFDGVYMDSTVYINGVKAFDWHSGYAAFNVDITEFVHDGDNEIIVQVRHKSPNSRWYSGAGIYRSVRLVKTAKNHIAYKGVYISANAETGCVNASAEIIGDADFIKYTVLDNDGVKVFEHKFNIDENAEFIVQNIKLWDLENPYLYTLKTELIECGMTVDTVYETFGFRTLKYDANEGFFLNGKYMKIKGVCKHHDLGALGAAMNYDALYRQLMLFKEMGVNAVRTSHNMPSQELMDICDKIGMLVNAESFDMWEMPKNPYDNHRFFKETARKDVESWVRICRNHPSMMMWSIGNEIYDTHANEHGYEIAEMLVKYVREFDPLCNAPETIGSNFIEWEGAQKIGEMLGLSGYNYTEKCYDDHHAKYPDTVIYGSETSSAVRSRGIYHFPANMPLLSHDDHQCSSLENSYVGWGRTAEDAWIKDRDRKFCAGQFVWTGIDYIGEPTPYSTKNSYFGMIDTAGLPKDVFYLYQSVWTDFDTNPMIHLLPYWDFNDGQIIDVIAYTNAPVCELFLNGTSLGKREIDHVKGEVVHANWQVPYEKGELVVKAYNLNGDVVCTDTQKSFDDPYKIKLIADKTIINAGGTSLAFIEISTVDENGTFVANARNRISIEVSGEGRLLGLDNGDSTDFEQYKTTNRRLFSGKLIAIIGSTLESGMIKIKASSTELESAEIEINSIPCDEVNGITALHDIIYQAPKNDVPIRKIVPIIEGTAKLDENNKQFKIGCEIHPANATFNDISCIAVKQNSVPDNICEVSYEDGIITVNALGDGDGIIRIYANNGSEFPQIISDVPYSITGLGEAERSPYQMISACTFNLSSIPLNIIENGALGGFHEKCYAGFSGLNFGKLGTNKLRLHVGNCINKDIPFEIWSGVPNDADSKLLYIAQFPHNNGWGSFMPYDFELPEKITGINTICIVIDEKCIFGGIEFISPDKAFEQLSVSMYDELYGDDYKLSGDNITQIGNNVVIGFNGMDFADGTTKITICGQTPNANNTIQLRYTENDANKTQLLEFAHADEYTERTFEIEKIDGNKNISFVFMPGSNFDFAWFKFEK